MRISYLVLLPAAADAFAAVSTHSVEKSESKPNRVDQSLRAREPTNTEQRVFDNLQVPAFMRQLFEKLADFFRYLPHGPIPLKPNAFRSVAPEKLETLRAEGDVRIGMTELEKAKEQAAKETPMTMPVPLRKADPTGAAEETLRTNPIAPRKAGPNAASKALVVEPTDTRTEVDFEAYRAFVAYPDADKFSRFMTAIYGQDARAKLTQSTSASDETLAAKNVVQQLRDTVTGPINKSGEILKHVASYLRDIATEDIFKPDVIQLVQVFAKTRGEKNVNTDKVNKVLLAAFDNDYNRFCAAVLRAEKKEGADKKAVTESKEWIVKKHKHPPGKSLPILKKLEPKQLNPRNAAIKEPLFEVLTDSERSEVLAWFAKQ